MKTLDPIFPRRAEDLTGTIPVIAETEPKFRFAVKTAITRPKVFIPTMPGTNCEVDSARAFERAGADTDIFIMRNRDAAELKESVEEMARRISRSQIVMFPGGFSAGMNRMEAASLLRPYSATQNSWRLWKSFSI